jgi:hypothetical protein
MLNGSVRLVKQASSWLDTRVARRMVHNRKNIILLLVLHNKCKCSSEYREEKHGHLAHVGEERRLYKCLVAKPEGKVAFGRLAVDGFLVVRT